MTCIKWYRMEFIVTISGRELREEVRRRVLDHAGVELHWEIKRIGVPAGG